VLRLDVRALHRLGQLSREGRSIVAWQRGDQAAGAIAVYTRPGDALLLAYTIAPYGGAPTRVVERVQLVQTSCTFGGTRSWFRCPGCQRRVAVLACLSGAFRCRHCLRLPYGSQSETPVDRMARKQQKLCTRGGITDHALLWRSPKPRGMHWRTWVRLLEEAWALEMARAQVLDADLERFCARVLRGTDSTTADPRHRAAVPARGHSRLAHNKE
jgi:hypothetical protein